MVNDPRPSFRIAPATFPLGLTGALLIGVVGACGGGVASGKNDAVDGGRDVARVADASAAREADAPALIWYSTCGYPVCGNPSQSDAATPADAEACADLGTSCSTKGQTCGVPNEVDCGSIEVCDDHDPKGPNGENCPISSRKFKDDIEYLDARQLDELHDETLRMRLATYNYKGAYADPNPKHLGFILEDNPQSLAVNRGHDRVDLYGYVSMIVATTQVQEREIAALRRELELIRGTNACVSEER